MSYVLNKVEKNWEIENGSGIKIVVTSLSEIERAVFLLNLKIEKPQVIEVKKEGNRREQVSAALSKKPQTARQIMAKIGGVKKDDEKFYASILSILATAKKVRRKKNSDGIYVYTAK